MASIEPFRLGHTATVDRAEYDRLLERQRVRNAKAALRAIQLTPVRIGKRWRYIGQEDLNAVCADELAHMPTVLVMLEEYGINV